MPPRKESSDKSDSMVRDFIDDIKKKDSDPNVYVGKVTKFLGNKRFEAVIDSDGIKTVQVAVPGKFSGRGRKGAMISPGTFVLLAEDESIKMFEMLALIKPEFLELINKLSPINPKIIKSLDDLKVDDGIEFDRPVATDDIKDDEIDTI
jgi:hypothetical protein